MKSILAILMLTFSLTTFCDSIMLMPHQQIPIDYLLKHEEQKGLLVMHEMGTGKTFLAIGLAEKYPEREVVIIAPRFLEAQWRQQMQEFGTTKQNRYSFVAYDDAPQKLLKRNLSNAILILDECHNIARYLKTEDIVQNMIYTDVYIHLKSAYKIICLTGTPIYNDEYDLAYILNLVTGQDLVPFNQDQFNLEHSKKYRGRSFWRGYITESMTLQAVLPAMLGFATVGIFIAPWASIFGAILGGGIFPVLNNILPIERYPLRHFDAKEFKNITKDYVSFHETTKADVSEFPTTKFNIMDVDYTPEQYRFFLEFFERGLSDSNLMRLLKEHGKNYDPSFVKINSTLIQNGLRSVAGAGRDIGNFSMTAKDGSLVDAPKLLKVLETIKGANTPATVVYSNYYQSGLMALAHIFDKHGLKNDYAILSPDMSAERQQKVVAEYNEGKVKILLLHPDITEGVSLKGTRQFHILEPLLNKTILDQVTARAVRYRSHAHLPKNERHVDIFLWKAVANDFQPKIVVIKKDHWRKRYSDLNYWSWWGKGRVQNDRNFEAKQRSPDDYAYLRMNAISDAINNFTDVVKTYSIEKFVNQN